MHLRPLLAALLLLVCAVPAAGVIIGAGSGDGNTTAPSSDPGMGSVGMRSNGLSAVYLGDGWILTANHVGAGDVQIGAVVYPWVPGSAVRLSNPDSSPAD